MKSIEKLVAYLMKTYHIPADHVLGHGETKATECPGRYINVALVRRVCHQMVSGSPARKPTRARPSTRARIFSPIGVPNRGFACRGFA